MKKNLVLMAGMVFLALILSGCGKTVVPQETSEKKEDASILEEKEITNKAFLNICIKEKVSLPNYGDPGQRLENCFVEYPGEPSRQDKSYYIVEDICGQFSKEFMENMYGAKLDRLETSQAASLNNCTYYFDEKEYLILNLEYLPIENQKKGNEAMDRKMEKNSKITMENFVAVQEDGAANAIYLVLNPNKFLSLRPSSKQAIGDEKFINLAANIAGAINGYK